EYGFGKLVWWTALRSDGRQTSGCCSSRSHDEAALYRAASVDAVEVGLSPKYRLLLDFDDEAGRGLLRLVALSIEGLPGGRLEEHEICVDDVKFDDADIGRRRCALDGDDTAAQREKRLAVVVGNH